MESINGIFLKLQYKDASVFSFTAPFSDVSSFKKTQPTGKNQQNSKQCCLPPLSFKINLNDTSFHILNSFYLISRMLVDFSLIFVYSTICRKRFSIYDVQIPRKCTESMHFYLCPTSPLQTPGKLFRKSFPTKTKGVENTMTCFIKI